MQHILSNTSKAGTRLNKLSKNVSYVSCLKQSLQSLKSEEDVIKVEDKRLEFIVLGIERRYGVTSIISRNDQGYFKAILSPLLNKNAVHIGDQCTVNGRHLSFPYEPIFTDASHTLPEPTYLLKSLLFPHRVSCSRIKKEETDLQCKDTEDDDEELMQIVT